ncbi:MAG TPA: SRPBCC family protein [Polyangia bacterium]|jgi:uncharacterized protein YndB with AHSA1/START domain|nr:SRPBCC family protein [Polyangia bacterium]
MAYESLSLSELIPATEEEIYSAWLSSDQHSAFTGDEASIDPVIGGKHIAYGGYAQGAIVDLQPSRRIVQTWRTSDFPEGSPDSRLEVTLEPTVGGTMVTVLHTEIPEGQSDSYREGWVKYYFDPLKKYFAEKSGDDAEDVLDDLLATAPANGISSHNGGPAKLTGRAKKAPTPQPKSAKETAKVQPKAKPKAKSNVKAKVKAKAKPKPKAKPKTKTKTKAKLTAKSAKKPTPKRRPAARMAAKKATRGRESKSPARSKKKKR